MKLNIKNKKIEDAINFENKFNISKADILSANTEKIVKSMSMEQIGMNILWGYVSSLAEIAEDDYVNLELDLTYDTVKNLALAAAYEFVAGSNPASGYSQKQNIETAEKTIAAYLMFLSINDDNCELHITEQKTFPEEGFTVTNKWSVVDIYVISDLRKFDFLEAIHGDVTVSGNELIVNMENIMSVYKQATRKDLAEYGVDSITGKLPEGTSDSTR